MYQLRRKNLPDIVAIYGRGRELFRPPMYTIGHLQEEMRIIFFFKSETFFRLH